MVLNPGSLDCSALTTRPLLHKKCRTVSFSTTPLSGCFCCMAIFGTQNKSVQIKIVLNFSVLLYCGVSQVFNTFQSRNQHMKCANAHSEKKGSFLGYISFGVFYTDVNLQYLTASMSIYHRSNNIYAISSVCMKNVARNQESFTFFIKL